MTTARDVSTGALRKIGVLYSGETPSSADAALCLSSLNDLINQWAAERLIIYEPNVRTTWTLDGSASYSLGSGGDIDIVRPVYINTVSYQDTSLNPVQEFSLGNGLTDQAWAALTPKALTSPLPTNWYYDPTFGANEQGTLYLWPLTTSGTLQGVLYAPQAITELATLDTEIVLPPGYRQFLVHALAQEVAPEFGRQVTRDLARSAAQAKGIVKRANFRPSDLQMDSGALVQTRRYGWSILTGS